MKPFHYTAVIWREGRHYVSKCPELGVASFGNSPERAKASLEEAVKLYLSNARKLGIIGDVKSALTSDDRFTSTMEAVAV